MTKQELQDLLALRKAQNVEEWTARIAADTANQTLATLNGRAASMIELFDIAILLINMDPPQISFARKQLAGVADQDTVYAVGSSGQDALAALQSYEDNPE